MKPELLNEVPVVVTVELGATKMPLKEFEELGEGSVIELDRLAGEPLSILVNGVAVAYGEVVAVNEKFGIRITDIKDEHKKE